MDCNSSASQATLAIQYKNVKVKLHNTVQNIKFNKECLRHGLKPNYVNIKVRNKSYAAKKALEYAERMWVKNEIRSLYRKKDMLNTLLLKKYLEVSNNVHPIALDCIISKVEQSVSMIIRSKKSTHKKKLTRLVNEQKCKETTILFDFEFYPRVVNNTDIVFNDDETSVLDKGLKYNLPRVGKKAQFNELINAEVAIKTIPDEDGRNLARVLASHKLEKKYRVNLTPRLGNTHKKEALALNSIREKLIDNDAVLCKADKGNTVVVMYKNEYVNKVNEFITNNNILEMKKDPTSVYQRKIRKLVNDSKVLFSEREIKSLGVMNPKAPMLRGLPKVHKEGVPIRPLVDYTSAPTYTLAKRLEQILSDQIILPNNYSLKNTYDFIDKTKNLNVRKHDLLVSFDIVNLFTNVPVDKTLDLVKNHLTTGSNMLPEAIDELVILLKEVLKQNYFNFNDKYYTQPDGLAMGSPLSGILSNIYLNYIENEFIFSNGNKQKNKILQYHRYVDDTILLFSGNIRQLDLLHTYLNSVTPNLKFTMEVEKSNKINFLDLTIEKLDNKLDFSIYRKPTTSDQTIHNTSYHPPAQKFAAYNSMVYRLLNVPTSPNNYEKELSIIKHIAVANGFESSMIDRLINKQKNKDNRDEVVLQDKKYVCVEYSHSLQQVLTKELRKHNVELAFKTNNKTINKLNVNRKVINKGERSGVYKIKCASCPSVYVGKTGRSFKIRYKEHHPNPRAEKQKSAFAQHVIDENHDINDLDTGLEILHTCTKGNKLDTLEEYEIYKAHTKNYNSEQILNDKLQFRSHFIFNSILNKRRESRQGGQSPTDNAATPGTTQG